MGEWRGFVGREVADPVDLARRLRLGGEWRREQTRVSGC